MWKHFIHRSTKRRLRKRFLSTETIGFPVPVDFSSVDDRASLLWFLSTKWRTFSTVGPAVGSAVGSMVGGSVCSFVGSSVGSFIGTSVGDLETGAPVGFPVGTLLGLTIGVSVGFLVGGLIGASVGALVALTMGALVGFLVGALVGFTMGATVGCFVGASVGFTTGALDGFFVGVLVSLRTGALDGFFVGAFVAFSNGATLGFWDGALVAFKIGTLVVLTVGELKGFFVGALEVLSKEEVIFLVGASVAVITGVVIGVLRGDLVWFAPAVSTVEGFLETAFVGPEDVSFEFKDVSFITDGAAGETNDFVGATLDRSQLSYPPSVIWEESIEQFPDPRQQQGRNSSGTSSRQGLQHALKDAGSLEPVLYPVTEHLPSSGFDWAKPSQHPQKSSGWPAFPLTCTYVGKTIADVHKSLFGIDPPPSKWQTSMELSSPQEAFSSGHFRVSPQGPQWSIFSSDKSRRFTDSPSAVYGRHTWEPSAKHSNWAASPATMQPPMTSIPDRSQEGVNTPEGSWAIVFDGILNGTDVLSNPEGRLGLDDCLNDLSNDGCEVTDGMKEGLSLSPSTDGANDGRTLPSDTDGWEETDGMKGGLSLSPSADGTNEGRSLLSSNVGRRDSNGEVEGRKDSSSDNGLNETTGRMDATLGSTLGALLGAAFGSELGRDDGTDTGAILGGVLGVALEPSLGDIDGLPLGPEFGENEGITLGTAIGSKLGIVEISLLGSALR
jgi:hypothetical protein